MTNTNEVLCTLADRRGSLDVVLNVKSLLYAAGLWGSFIANIMANDDIPKYQAEQWFFTRQNENPDLIIQKAFVIGRCKYGTPEQWANFQQIVTEYFKYHPLNYNYIYVKK